jgi:hypothetical protein
MDKIKIEDSEAPITKENLIQFEVKYKIVLPENYKKLLMKYNGGVESDGDKVIDSLYSIKYGDMTVEQAIETLQINEQILPREYLPIGNSGTGHEITLCINGSEKGKIFLFRHDSLEPEVLANSLEELMGIQSIDQL